MPLCTPDLALCLRNVEPIIFSLASRDGGHPPPDFGTEAVHPQPAVQGWTSEHSSPEMGEDRDQFLLEKSLNLLD